jgi:hypothetical protein
MFDNDRLKEPHIHNHEWVKRLRKGTDLEDIGKAIKDRIEWPNSTGPYVNSLDGEVPTDIIAALLDTEPDLHEKVEKAVGLLLFKVKRGDIGPSNAILQGLFTIIRTNQLFECSTLVHNWLKENVSALLPLDRSLPFYTLNPQEARRNSYKDALHAFAYVQGKNEELEHWWFNLWRESDKFWQFYAFIGLRRQNPEVARDEIPLLLDRKIPNTSSLLSWFWRDETSRKVFVNAIREGLVHDVKWTGLAMNEALAKMWPVEKEEFIAELKGNGVKLIENTTQTVLTNDI